MFKSLWNFVLKMLLMWCMISTFALEILNKLSTEKPTKHQKRRARASVEYNNFWNVYNLAR